MSKFNASEFIYDIFFLGYFMLQLWWYDLRYTNSTEFTSISNENYVLIIILLGWL